MGLGWDGAELLALLPFRRGIWDSLPPSCKSCHNKAHLSTLPCAEPQGGLGHIIFLVQEKGVEADEQPALWLVPMCLGGSGLKVVPGENSCFACRRARSHPWHLLEGQGEMLEEPLSLVDPQSDLM